MATRIACAGALIVLAMSQLDAAVGNAPSIFASDFRWLHGIGFLASAWGAVYVYFRGVP